MGTSSTGQSLAGAPCSMDVVEVLSWKSKVGLRLAAGNS